LKKSCVRRAREEEPSSYFYLYRVAFMWYSVIGTVVSVGVGYLASLVFARFSSGSPFEPEPSLFVPPVARRIRRRRLDAAKVASSQLFVLDEHKLEQ
jgi:hypothetical protein